MEPFNAQQQPDPNMPGAVLQGAQMGQQLRGISALSGIDINDPDSLNKGIANLVRAGAADQASALMGLSITRSVYGGLPGFMAQVTGSGGQAAPAAAQAPAAGAPADQAQAPDPTAALHAQIATDARAYSTASPADQAAMKPQLEAKYSQLGIAKPDIDAALQAVSTPEGAAQFAGMHDAHAQMHASGQGDAGAIQGALPAGMAPPAQGDGVDPYAWAKNYLSHPQWGAYEAMVKSKLGLDLGYTARAQAIMGPEFAQEAAVRNARGLSGETEAGKAPYDISEYTLKDGSKVSLSKPDAMTLARLNLLHGPTPGQVSEQQAAGTAKGAAPYKIETAPTGVPGQTSAFRLLPNPNGGPPIPTPIGGGGAGPTFGTSAGTAAEHNAAGQADALNAESTEAGNRLSSYPAAISRGQAIQALAETVGTGAYTGALQKAAQYLPGGFQKYAGNAGLLAQHLSGTFKDAIQGVPASALRTNIEAKTITGAMPKINSVQSQVQWYAAANLAAVQYNQARDRWITQYTSNQANPRDLSAANAAWAAGPGNRSLFSEPAWKNVTLGGKPAVIPYTNRNGQPRLAVGAGIFKTPIITTP